MCPTKNYEVETLGVSLGKMCFVAAVVVVVFWLVGGRVEHRLLRVTTFLYLCTRNANKTNFVLGEFITHCASAFFLSQFYRVGLHKQMHTH